MSHQTTSPDASIQSNPVVSIEHTTKPTEIPPASEVSSLQAVYNAIRDALCRDTSERLTNIIGEVMLAALHHLAEESAARNAVDELLAEGKDMEEAADEVFCTDRIDRICEAVEVAVYANDIHGVRLNGMVDTSVTVLLHVADRVADEICPRCDEVHGVVPANEPN
jgi:hypothetical protein